jgi:alpha-1,3-rhamnosyl/mannosyltransferase
LFHGTDFSVPYVARRPAVMTLHDLSPWMDRAWQPDARVRRRTPRLLRWGLAHRVITPTEAVRVAAIERFGLPPAQVTAVPMAAGDAFRHCLAVPRACPYFLFVGTLEPRKGVPQLIAAWREVRRRHDVDLLLAGRVRGDFEAPREETGLHMLGPVPDAELPALYSGALACVYPSLYEGFGLPVLEAMQCGALVITSHDPAIAEVAGGAAIHSTGEALAEAMEAVVRDPDRFAAVRQRALARAAQFSWRDTARRTREVYEAAASDFGRR